MRGLGSLGHPCRGPQWPLQGETPQSGRDQSHLTLQDATCDSLQFLAFEPFLTLSPVRCRAKLWQVVRGVEGFLKHVGFTTLSRSDFAREVKFSPGQPGACRELSLHRAGTGKRWLRAASGAGWETADQAGCSQGRAHSSLGTVLPDPFQRPLREGSVPPLPPAWGAGFLSPQSHRDSSDQPGCLLILATEN